MNPIERYASRVQRLPPELRWIAASMQGWIQARGMGREPERGPWEIRAGRIVRLAGSLGLERHVTFAVNAVLSGIVWATQGRSRWPARGRLFVGIGALREPVMENRFADPDGAPLLSIDARGIAGFSQHGRVGLRTLWRELRAIRRGVWQLAAAWEAATGIAREHMLTCLMMRGHQFAYFRAWFRTFLDAPGVSRLVASTASSGPAHAAVAAGAEVVYMLHGFQRHSVIYPEFARAVSITGVEANHMRRRLPRCEVTVAGVRQRLARTRRVAAVAGIFWEPDNFDLVRPFIEWARSNDLPIVVRPHPADRSGYWEQWRHAAGFEIRESDTNFEAFLDEVQPRFLASWYSTALFDALARGTVPVTVCPDSEELLDTVYPVRDLAICWPEQRPLAEQLIDDDAARADFLTRLFGMAMDDEGRHATQAVPAAPVCT